MDQQGKSSDFLLQRDQLQNQTPDAGPEDHDASCKGRLVSCSIHLSIASHKQLCYLSYLTNPQILCLDTKMDRKDKLFVINEVSLLFNILVNSYITYIKHPGE